MDPSRSTPKLKTPNDSLPPTDLDDDFAVTIDDVEYVLYSMKAELDRIPKPKTRRDFFNFTESAKEILDYVETQFLLKPLPSEPTKGQKRLSIMTQRLLRDHIPRTFIEDAKFPTDTYGFLEFIKAQTPDFADFRLCPLEYQDYIFPCRGKNEDVYSYISRARLWMKYHLPDETPGTVRFCSGCMWAMHTHLYNVSNLSDKYYAAASTFQSYSDVYRWFKTQTLLISPPPNDEIPTTTRNIPENGNSKGIKFQGSVKVQRTSSSVTPVAASADHTTSSVGHGNVDKNGKSKSSKKRAWNKKKKDKF